MEIAYVEVTHLQEFDRWTINVLVIGTEGKIDVTIPAGTQPPPPFGTAANAVAGAASSLAHAFERGTWDNLPPCTQRRLHRLRLHRTALIQLLSKPEVLHYADYREYRKTLIV